SGRRPLFLVLPEVEQIARHLEKVRGVERVCVAGSLRRCKETIGDGDILVASSHPVPVIEAFTNMAGVARVLAKGDTKASVTLASGMDVDLRVVPLQSWGAALNYFTGSKEHNVALRKIAIAKGWKLNEYGLYSRRALSAKRKATREWKMIAGRTEEEVYGKLGLAYIEPEVREMTGELDAAKRQATGDKRQGLPKLIAYGSLKGDLQTQTTWTDGANTIEEMATAAMAHGLEYIAITDHSQRLKMAHGLTAERLREQGKEIDTLNAKFKDQNSKFRILKGIECDILKDGSLDLPDDALAGLDVVGVSVHSHFNLSRDEQTSRIMRAMENPHADILFHPTGRILGRRDAYEVDMKAIITAAKRTGTVLEINSLERLDLRDEHVRMAVEAGVKLAINSDAHTKEHFAALEIGISQARRGWAEKRDVINAWPLEKMLASLK
ncbi:MAG: PHP domain-containing protein, partial [Candidatus Colwellbacteria bacterium]|nr:PHP domain-containing protein [Candidatus Colwellbacteria bacterium]